MTARDASWPRASLVATGAKIAFVDASAMVALADREDASHPAAVDGYRELIAAGFHLMTTDLALAEAHEILLAALGADAAHSWLRQANIEVHCVVPADVDLARQSIVNGQLAAGTTLAEAIHLALLDRLEITDVFAVDRQFLSLLD